MFVLPLTGSWQPHNRQTANIKPVVLGDHVGETVGLLGLKRLRCQLIDICNKAGNTRVKNMENTLIYNAIMYGFK